jgi:hypothetical protein
MRINLQKIAYIVFILCLCFNKTTGQTSTKEITDKFFGIYSTDPVKALEYGFSTNKWAQRKQDDIESLKNKMKNIVSVLGEYFGYEQLSEKTAGNHVKMVTFIARYDREPLRFTFLFYKPKDTWRLNNFSYDEEIDKDLDEASKAYRFRENNNY